MNVLGLISQLIGIETLRLTEKKRKIKLGKKEINVVVSRSHLL